MLLAADVGQGVRDIDWDGRAVAARADSWIVRADAASLGVKQGWTATSLGGGFLALRAPAASAAEVRGWAAATPGVRYVEPDFVITTAATPNDPSYSRLWGLHNTGQTGGVTDADMDVPEAWDTTTGSRSVVVGVIDTGIDHRHPDLAANMWRNPGEVAGDRIDNDGNGYVDDVYGWDFANSDTTPSYPANYPSSAIISVAATDTSNRRAPTCSRSTPRARCASRAGSATAPTRPETWISTGSCSPLARRSSSTSMRDRSPAAPR